VDCTQVRQKLVDFLEGALGRQERADLTAHTARCSECRAELEELERARRALLSAVPWLAPVEPHLTASRIQRLMQAAGHAAVPARVIWSRRLVAAAAVAAILVSGVYIASDLKHYLGQSGEPVASDVATGQPPQAPVVLASMNQGEPVRVLRTIWLATSRAAAAPPGGVQLAATDSAGVVIPVEHPFYDPEESARWW